MCVPPTNMISEILPLIWRSLNWCQHWGRESVDRGSLILSFPFRISFALHFKKNENKWVNSKLCLEDSKILDYILMKVHINYLLNIFCCWLTALLVNMWPGSHVYHLNKFSEQLSKPTWLTAAWRTQCCK